MSLGLSRGSDHERVFLLVFLVALTTSLFWKSFASKFAFLCDCNVVEWRSTTYRGSEAILQEIHEFGCASKNRESFFII